LALTLNFIFAFGKILMNVHVTKIFTHAQSFVNVFAAPIASLYFILELKGVDLEQGTM
jgi:hypothetical protein